jgi:hypothetical protein
MLNIKDGISVAEDVGLPLSFQFLKDIYLPQPAEP